MFEMYIDTKGLMDERTARMLSKWMAAYGLTADARRFVADDLAKVNRVIADLSREQSEHKDE